MKPIDARALFRLSVLGPLVSRERLARGELQAAIRELASHDYTIPNSNRRRLGEKTIQAWYYRYQRGGIDALVPKSRADRDQSKLPAAVQEAILAAKRDNPRRSLRQIRQLLECAGVVARGRLSRSAIHRLLQRHGLSRPTGSSSGVEEKRSFEAEFANTIWYSDVMHEPGFALGGKQRKLYLVTLLDDASRLAAHSAFCLGETALDVEGVFKQALLKRSVPKKLVVDQGSAYRANTLQGICARLGVQLSAPCKGTVFQWVRIPPGSLRSSR